MELLYKRSTSARARQLQMARNDNFKAQHWIYLCRYLVPARARRLLASRPHWATCPTGAFNALPWIIYTQIEMSHSRRSGCLSRLQPPSVFCPFRSANRLYLLSKSPIRFRLFTVAYGWCGRCFRMDGIWLIWDLSVLSAVLSAVRHNVKLV